jgi:phage/plasmid-associated DNA primase
MQQRDAASEREDGARAVTGAQVVIRAAGQRRRAVRERAHAAEQRALAAADRRAAAADRAQAAAERLLALADRDALAAQLAIVEGEASTPSKLSRATR